MWDPLSFRSNRIYRQPTRSPNYRKIEMLQRADLLKFYTNANDSPDHSKILQPIASWSIKEFPATIVV